MREIETISIPDLWKLEKEGKACIYYSAKFQVHTWIKSSPTSLKDWILNHLTTENLLDKKSNSWILSQFGIQLYNIQDDVFNIILQRYSSSVSIPQLADLLSHYGPIDSYIRKTNPLSEDSVQKILSTFRGYFYLSEFTEFEKFPQFDQSHIVELLNFALNNYHCRSVIRLIHNPNITIIQIKQIIDYYRTSKLDKFSDTFLFESPVATFDIIYDQLHYMNRTDLASIQKVIPANSFKNIEDAHPIKQIIIDKLKTMTHVQILLLSKLRPEINNWIEMDLNSVIDISIDILEHKS